MRSLLLLIRLFGTALWSDGGAADVQGHETFGTNVAVGVLVGRSHS